MSLFFEDEPQKPKEDKNFKVRCIDDSPFDYDLVVEGELVKGRIYNVESVVETNNGHGFNITGLSVRHKNGSPMAFGAHRFTVLRG